MSTRTRVLSTVAALALAALALPAEAKDLKSIGVTVGNLGNPFFVQIVEGAKAAAAKISGGKANVTAVSADYDLNKQYSQIDNFIASGVDIILVNASDPNAIEPAIKAAQAAGVVVMAVDVAAKGADATVQTNNVQAGELACQYIVDKLKGKGNVIIQNGPPVSAVIDRVDGCKAVLAKSKDIKILSDNQNAKGSREGGLEVATGLLTAFDKVDAFFTINDPQAIGTDLAGKQLKRKDFFITSVDGAPDIEVALKTDTVVEASASQDPFAMAKKAVEIGFEIMNGKRPDKDMILIPAELVTRQNVAQYKGWTSK